jgi:hypothetical protein
MPAKADQALGALVESKLAKAGATDTLEAARKAMRAGDSAEAQRLFAQVEKHLTVEEANLVWRELGRLTEAVTRAEFPIKLFGEQHVLKVVQGEEGAFFVLCSWCARVRDVLTEALRTAKAAKKPDELVTKRLDALIEQVKTMEKSISSGAIPKAEATSTNTMRSLLQKLSESEHLLGTALNELPVLGVPNFTGLAADAAMAQRAAELYPGYLQQLFESRQAIFRVGKAQRKQLFKELESEAQARALIQARNEVRPGALELAPGAPARTAAELQPAVDIPFGFYNRQGFEQLSGRLYTALPDGSGARLIVEGSAVTGRRFERIAAPYGPTGAPFNLGRLSDYDIAIVSDSLFAKAKSLKIVSGKALESEVLTSAQLKQLGLSNLEAQARAGILEATGIAQPVHFKLRPVSTPSGSRVGLPMPGGGG